MSKLSYKRRVLMLMSLDAVHNIQGAAPGDWAIARLWIPDAQAADGEVQASNLAAIHQMVGAKILNDYGEVDMQMLDPSAMSEAQFEALLDACDYLGDGIALLPAPHPEGWGLCIPDEWAE